MPDETAERPKSDGGRRAAEPGGPGKRRRRWPWLVFLALGLGIAVVANAGYYLGSAYSGELCGRCHVIRSSVDLWRISSHRNIDCGSCHGSALTLNPSEHKTHWGRLYLQLTDQLPVRVVLKDEHVDALVERCGQCHQAAYAEWKAGGHSMRYADVFLNAQQNESTLLNDDCVRCHGMFFDGGNVSTIVEPVSTEGPWKMAKADLGARPAIPCLACHQMHRGGEPARRPDYARPELIAELRKIEVYSLAFFDQRERIYRSDEELPSPAMKEGDRLIKMSPDPRQRLCYQCHAPEAGFQVKSGDDRSPIGVHEGISCQGCHRAHSQDARASCKTCHPRLSNCGLEVETMDTTFRSPGSANNIHFVKCADCHPRGVPGRPAAGI